MTEMTDQELSSALVRAVMTSLTGIGDAGDYDRVRDLQRARGACACGNLRAYGLPTCHTCLTMSASGTG